MMSLYFLITIIYFYLEGFTGVSVGKYLSGIRTARLNSRGDKTHPRNIYSLLLLKSVVKVSIGLLFVAALIETWVTGFLLYHFYFN